MLAEVFFLCQPRSQALSPLPPFVVGRKTLVAAGHVTTCDTNFFTRVESTNNFCRYQLKRKNYTLANTALKFFSPILSFIQDKRNILVCIQRIEVSLFISIPAGRIKRKLFHSILLELTSWHIVRYIKRCFIYCFAEHNS